MKKKTIIHRLIYSLTIFIPSLTYIILSATMFSIKADYILTNAENMEIEYLEREAFLYSSDNSITFNGKISYNEDLGVYGVYIGENEIVKVDKYYMGLRFDEEIEDKFELVDIKLFEIEKKESISIPIIVYISLFGGVIIFFIVSGKMRLVRKYPRIATLVSLIVGTSILFVLDLIISNLLGIFIVFTISWFVYVLEHAFINGNISLSDKDKERDKLLDTLNDLIKR